MNRRLRSRMIMSAILGQSLMLCLPSRAQHTLASGMIDFQIVDSLTGRAVGPALIRWDPDSSLKKTNIGLTKAELSSAAGRFAARFSPDTYLFDISAPAYRTMHSHFTVIDGAEIRVNIALDPIEPPSELRDELITQKLRRDFELVTGYVVDGNTHMPLSNVRIRFQQSDVSTTTDTAGYFEAYVEAVPTDKVSRPEDFPDLDSVSAVAIGYRSYTLKGVLHTPGAYSVMKIELAAGTGTIVDEEKHGALLGSEAGDRPAAGSSNSSVTQGGVR